MGTKIIEKAYTSTSFNLFDDFNLIERNGFIEFSVLAGYKGAQYIKKSGISKIQKLRRSFI